ncbi:hypothetical protein [Mumia zhuanghuii]|uniref:Uncharacterized protein n=1 Tax=Mumia zhuanghuii TaxID=2585211 RepID=A0A5C4MIG2_9ACTN|nr:hypothetical protein [Mumia zhuanghuii]TNC31243.1 hypothetical protein FHE65_31685 [Mumia zhuanghuii]TNC44896.1 hypothetical protein FHE65_15815 [Mumia zhuanghuii]
MPWDERFAAMEHDLTLQAETEAGVEREQEINDLATERSAQLSWADRCLGLHVTVRVVTAGIVRGELAMVTADWVLVHHDGATDWVVALRDVVSVVPSGGTPVTSRGEVQRRMTWRQAWNALVRDRDEVHVLRRDGSSVRGIPVVTGFDHVEIAGELVPYEAVVAVRCPR